MRRFDLIRKIINFPLTIGVIILCTTIAFNIHELLPDKLLFTEKLFLSVIIGFLGIFAYLTVYSRLNDIIVDAHLYYNKLHLRIQKENIYDRLQFSMQTPLESITPTDLAKYIHNLPPHYKKEFNNALQMLQGLDD